MSSNDTNNSTATTTGTTVVSKQKLAASVGDSINQFSFKLLKAFISRHKYDSRNMCFSPFEVFNSLIMLLLGAKGTSEAQLEDMLCLRNFNCKKKYDDLIDLREFIIKNNHDIMVGGTFIYIDKRVQIQPEYCEKLRDIFETKPKRVDFTRPEEAVKTINKDASETTDGVIEGVISTKEIEADPHVKLIIANTAFFRGFWQMKFGDIQKEDFFYSKGTKSAKIDMMSHMGQHRYFYCKDLNVHTVSIQYAASEIRMMMILPDKRETECGPLMEQLNAEKLVELFGQLQRRQKSVCELIIPRFALDAHQVSLQKSVKMMGAKSIYEHDQAQLGGICGNDSLHLTKLVHKAFILVDERGSHGTHSGSTNRNTQLSREESRFMHEQSQNDNENGTPVQFKANHPFVFIILDKDTNVICFIGLLSDPTAVLEVVNESELSIEQIHQLLVESDNKNSEDSYLGSNPSSTSTG